jgi:excinuclease ABC subunit C
VTRTGDHTPERDLREQLAAVPESPGVYLWKDARGEVLYVGKAKALRRRMRQYVTGHDEREKIPVMMEQVAGFDYYVTGTEVESLILEANLIKQFRPPFNVNYRDDKTYPYIAVTVGDPFPAIKYTRERHRPGTRYFGPYTDARAARETIDVVRRVYRICRTDCVQWKKVNATGGKPVGRACFDYQVGLGPGPCVGAITREEYAGIVGEVTAFLDGKRHGLPDDLERDMRAAAADLDFERAARLRNALEAVQSVLRKQQVVASRPLDADVIGIHREETIAGVHVFLVREGRVLAGNEFVLDKGLDVPEAELVEGFLLQYYASASHVPKQVIVPTLPEDPDTVAAWLARLRGAKVVVAVPQRGEKKRLAELGAVNARHALGRYKFRVRYDEGRLNAALLQLESALSLPAPPLRIEAYDISTIHGSFSVGSMVVFHEGRPESSQYRRFKVRLDTEEANDVAMMAEVIRRRFAREAREGARFARRPDLLLIDGGRPQIGAVRAVLAELGLADIPVVGLAKRDEELFTPDDPEPIVLPAGSASLYLVKRVRDEAHRFAIEYHRKLRGKAMTASALDEVPGVGPKRRTQLVKHFGSVKRLREADVDAIAAVPGVPRQVAQDVWAVLHEGESESEAGGEAASVPEPGADAL